MGITPVAIYSDLDSTALHVRMADEAYALPPSVILSAAKDPYLSIDAIVRIARKAKVDAIHPGYGFLAENEEFAAAVIKAGLCWIGPPPKVIATLGSKTAARKLAKKARVPLIDGTINPLRSIKELRQVAARIGFPVLLKAVAGGGGKGMRIVHAAEQLESAFELARGEAQNAFGNGDIYIEQYIANPHHVEVQILADHHGRIIHLGERECSIQRRHQKVVEEAPSPFITSITRKAMCTAAVRIAKTAGYRNAGTVEFLVDAQQRFYFLEVNTRIQVEHPITEMITGIDIVREQIQIAAGLPMSLRQAHVECRGHAIECRICAEDPLQNFMPSPGTMTSLREPHGYGVRLDSGVASGSNIPMNYDPLLAKLCVWGRTRAEAIARMERAIQECQLTGITTNLFLHRQIMQHPDFRRGRYTTHFLEDARRQLLERPATAPAHALVVAAIAKLLQPVSLVTPSTATSRWKTSARHEGMRSGLDSF